MTDTTPNLNGAGLNFFSIRSENNRGVISIVLPLYTDNQDTPVYTFSVRARDNGSPTQFSVDQASVRITVYRNLFPPIFQGTPYTATLNFNSVSGTTVKQVNATDADAQSPHNVVTHSIIGDATAQTLFSINAASGLITTRQSLLNNNVESSSILIEARDGGTPSLSATSTVSVTISRNLNPPEWVSTSYTVNITETQDLGVTITNMNTRDADTASPYNTRITTLTGEADMLQFFRLTENGRLSVQRPLTLSTRRSFTGTVSLQDGGNPPLTPTGVKTATITVYVSRNDHTPYFINDPYSKDLEGNIQTGASVLQVTARDNDQGPFGIVRYRVTGDDLAPTYFQVDPTSGLITVRNVLSGVNQDQFKVRIEAYDQGSPSKTNVTVVTLTVKSNYQRPIFNRLSYVARIPETQSLGQQIIAVTANDTDALAPNNVVRYSLTAGPEDIECFLIDAVTGSLSLRRSLLYDPCRGDRYQMTVTATDQGLNPLSNSITVTVDVDRNANPPIFQNIPTIISINENQPTGQGFFTVTATDADTVSPFNDIRYSLVGDGTATVYFQVDQSTGLVTLRQTVQADTASTYRLAFRATDGGNPPRYDEKILTVNVNRNLLSPEFVKQDYAVTIWETQALNVLVEEVLALDNDTKAPHNEVTYEIVSDALAQNYFRIDTEGRIYVRIPLTDDSAKTGLYTLSVRANDKGTPQRSSNNLATVRVTVLRNRNCPTFTPSVVPISIDQSSLSRMIYDANATDPDTTNTPFSTIRYTLIGDESAPSFFRIDSQSGQVTTIEPSLFSDQGTVYQLRIQATDAVNTATSCSGNLVLRVTVNRNLNSPVWINVNSPNNYVRTIFETQSVTQFVVRIQATDSDDKAPNNVVSYAMTTNSPNRDLFFVDVDGYVFLRNSLVGQTGDPYTVRFVATDGGVPARTSPEATLTVNVIRNQFPPEITNLPTTVNISENQLVNQEIFRVTGRDNDTSAPFNTFTFELVGDNEATTYFQVAPGGSVTLRQSITTDPSNSFQLRVRAKDGGTPQRQDEELLTVRVDRNLRSPLMTARTYSARILEIQAVSEPLVTVQATDGDTFAPNNQLRYFIVGSNTTITDYFMVNEDNGGVMLRRSMLDYPNQATRFTVNFQVNAADRGSVPRTANNPQLVSISVVRNTAPYFENVFTYQTQVQQNAAGGTVVFTPSGRDADADSPFNTLTYSLIGDDPAPSVFQINPSTGAISTKPTTNLTQTSGNFVARVQVTDGGSPPLSDTATVSINVERNLNSPRFLHLNDLTVNIPEILSAGSNIIDLNATDDDAYIPNNVISYVITGGVGNPLEYFFINPGTGVIVLQKSVKSIATSNFRLTVEARDQGSPQRFATATVHINVLRDSGVLTFSANNYNATISENTPVSASVVTTVASPGASIVYTLLGIGSGPDYFGVNPTSGQVNVIQALTQDASRLTSYRLLVQAVNQGVSTQTATSTVNIIVTRNENGPVFQPTSYVVTVQDTIPLGSNITQVTASDADNDPLNYRILSGSPYTELFYLDPVTGVITLKGVLLGRTENQYTFTVQASDQRTPEKTTTANVVVNVIKDQFSPEFIRTPYNVQTTENTPDGTIIFNTEAIDRDLKERIVYTVIGDNAAPAFFGVISDRGNITIINQALLRKDVGTTYTLRLTAHDTRYPNNKANATVTITVRRNLNAPVFSLPSYSRTVLDTIPLGDQVVQVNATDADGDQIRYSIIGDSRAQTYYYINPETGWITIKRHLTTGNQDNDQIQVQACDQRDPQNCRQALAFITIDRNKVSPVFVNTPYSRSLGQGTPASQTVVFTVSATDQDMNPNTGSIMYDVIGNYPAPSFFSLNTTTGQINVARGLMEDSLQRSQYDLVVIAYDTQYPTDRATATVTIVVNRNPNPPAFTQSIYSVQVAESLPLGSNITQVSASDADNDPVSYFFSSGGNTGADDLNFFYLNAETGVITLKSLLTSTSTNTFTFDVTARDPSGKVGSAQVNVLVIRDQPPVFEGTPYRVQIVESQQTNLRVYTVSARDPDRKGSIVYGVAGSLNAPFFFGVDNSSGEVAINNDLRKDIQQQYKLVVTAYDSGSPGKTATATLTIDVTKNPSNPQFGLPSYTTTIWEDRAPGSNILNITATDADNDVLRFDLLSDGTAASNRALMYFSLDPTNGQFFVAKSLMDDTTKAAEYNLKVRVRDQQYPDYEKSAEANVRVIVNRNRQSPFFLGTYARELSENSPISISILQVSAQDSDSRPTSSLRYEATGFGSAPYFFYLSPTNGSIYIQNDLRSEKNVFQYVLQVQAYDVAYPNDRATTNVTITITRNENAPQFDRVQYSANISESTAINVVVLQLNATDRDIGDRITYGYDGANPVPFTRLFSLSPNTGVITVQADLTTDLQPAYTATVYAYDNSNPERKTAVQVIISVYRDRSSPQFSVGNQTVTVSENAAIGTSVAALSADDSDRVGVVTYEVTGVYPAPSLFSVHPTNGVVSVAKDLQFEAVRSDSQYRLTVEAYDSFRPNRRASATVTILVLRNPSTPTWALPAYAATIREDHPPFSSIVQVTATDQDQEDKLSYDIVNEIDEKALSSGASDNFYIDTDTGMIYLKKNLMNTPFTRFILTVQACDDGVPHKCANTTVTITISEDKNAPVFNNAPFIRTINENYVVGQEVLVVTAVDNNALAAIRYMMEPPVPRYFAIDEATGNITVAKSLNTSLETTYSFKISTYDSGEPQYKSTADVTIIVIRNLNQPRFLQNPYNVQVDQNANYGSTVVNTTAVDDDKDILRYTMTGSGNSQIQSEVQMYFDIGPDDGVVYLKQLLTNVPRQSYTLFVFARDQRPVNEKTGTATVNVVIDFDETPRYLDNLPYRANIIESQTIDSLVSQLRAQDPDLKGDLTYEAIGMYPAEDYFSVNSSTGAVRLIRDLKTDPSGLTTYTLRVVAYDSLYPRLKATADVIISVTRNPFAPSFSPSADYSATVQENVTLGYSVLDINATDVDNDPVTFAIVASAPAGGENFFYLDPNSGLLTTKRLLTTAPNNFYQMTIQASDGRGRAANATARITITRIPTDQRPFFVSTPNRTITFREAVNSQIVTVIAQDPNPVGSIRYELVGIYPAQDFFAVNPTTGVVNLIKDLATDNFETMQYTLRLEAYDTNNPNLRAVGLSFITVIRNPASPVFEVGDYSMSIEEIQPVGSILLEVNATDNDGDQVLYDVVQDSNGIQANEFFLVNRENGKIYLTRDLRTTTLNSFTFQVRARDQGRPEKFSTARVTFTIRRDNGPPSMQREYFAQIAETEPVNNIIPFTSIQALDNNIRGSLVYEEEGDGLAMSYFALNRNTGAITVQKSLLTTNETNFVLRAIAYDTYYPDNKANTTVRITVIRNPNAPQFSQSAYETEINEYHSFGVTVFTVSAGDADKDVVLFSIEPPNDYFYIEKYSGRIYIRRSPSENPSVSEYKFYVLASDQRSPPRISNATMTIRIRRNQPPRFLRLPEFTSTSENAADNFVVYTVQATDPDKRPAARLVYTVVGDGSGPSFFTLDNSTGEVRPKAGLRNDTALQYVLRISVYDEDIPDMRTTSTLTISVLRNTNQPLFSQRSYVYNITDTTRPSTVVGRPTASDLDGDRLQYYYTAGDATHLEYFYVNRDTAEIILIKNLDTTALRTFNLQIRAEDGRVPLKSDTVQVTINVARDLELPVFINRPYVFNTDEQKPVNFTVGSVSAVDPDIRGRIQYEVVGIYPAPSFFDVDKDTGAIRITRDLKEDKSATGTYVLRISAYDSRDPSKFTTEDVTINVARNLSPPRFSQDPYSRTITELYPMGVPVLNISATDSDQDTVSYSIVRDNTGGSSLVYFYIDANGRLHLRQPLTSPGVPGQFSMVVAATDSGRPARTTEVNVFITVTKINPPRFLGTPYTRNLEERTANGTSIITVRTDASTDIVYEIVGEPPAPYLFFVDQTGDIHIKRDLTTDKSMQYTIRVRAYQRNTPSKYSETDVIVNMLRNVNPPVFTPDRFDININYDDPVGSRIIQVQAADADQDNLQYSITGDAACQNTFYIISATGEVFLGKNLKTTSDVTFRCTLSVTDNGYPTPKVDTAPMVINVIRGTNPVFGSQDTTVNLREDVPLNTQVGNPITATRIPAPQFPDTMVYEIIGQYPAQSFFGVNNATGQISVIQDLRLDGLKTTQYKVLVLAYGTDKPDLRSTATVTVNVQRNLNGPRFFPQTDRIELPETTGIDFWSMPQNVTDPDSSKITCSIISDAKSVEYFKVDPDTCVLSLRKSLKDDPDLTTTYNVVIQATDNGQPPQSSQKTVVVTVPRDLSKPRFQNLPQTITIDETRQAGSSVFVVSATDDLRGRLQYSIVGDLPAPSFFQIDPNTGNMTLRNSPKSDGLASSSYTVRIQVIDDAWPNNPEYGELTVQVTRNRQGPQLNPSTYNQNIRASNPVGSTIVTIGASDPDGDKLVFVNRGTANDKKYFFVQPETGAVIQIGDLTELTTQTTFRFNVDVSDTRQPQNTVTASVTITVTPLSGPPVFTQNYYTFDTSIVTPVNASVGTVSAVDNDLQGAVVYKVNGFTPGTEYFRMDPAGSFVYIRVNKRLLDNPSVTSYLLLLEAYDDQYPEDKSYASVTINILKNVNPPVIVPSQMSATVNDYDPPGTPVIDVNATDLDQTLPEKTLLYTIEAGRDPMEYFTIDPISGLISVDRRLSEDLSRPSEYVLRVIARDTSATPQSATATVTVSVNRNTRPQFVDPARFVFSPSEARAVYDSLFVVSATDPDSPLLLNGQLEFYFVGPVNASRVFGIDPVSGSIFPRISLQDVTQDRWTFTVGVRDKGIPPLSVETPVTANIQRIGKPVFDSVRIDVTKFENAPVDEVVTPVTARDPLPGSTLVYEIRGDGLAGEYFKIGTDGVIRINKSLFLDDNKTPTYRIRVVAYRQTDPLQQAEAFVYVLVIRNPNQPFFSHGNLETTINENTEISSFIISVNATDNDQGENGEIVYFFSSQESQPVYAANYFYINPTTGDITLSARLRDDPNTPQYQLRVIARDKGVPSKQAGVTVTIKIERNPHPPSFIQRSYEADVNESIPVGSSVIQLAAQDLDGDPIVYSINYDPPASLYFNIDGNTGLIRTATTLYQDEADRYVLLVTASDQTLQGTATVTVRVHRNVHRPVFADPTHTVTISEYEDLNTIIYRVVATDNDNNRSSSGILRYSLLRTSGSVFIISPTTGEIQLAQSLTNNKTADQYTLTVMAKDVSSNPKNATGTVTVNIVRNQFTPEFNSQSNITTAKDLDSYGTSIVNVSAIDRDRENPYSVNTPNAQVVYSLPSDLSTDNRFFHITPEGNLKVTQPLPTNADKTELPVRIRACDKSWNQKCSDIQLNIPLTHHGSPEGRLGFKQPVYYKEVPENFPLSNVIVEMDVEYQGASSIKCTIADKNMENRFSTKNDNLNKNCQLILLHQLDFSVQDKYNVTVTVTADDSQTRRKRQIYVYNTYPTATVIIQVLDVNNNPPQFVYPMYPVNPVELRMYFGAIANDSRPDQQILEVHARDLDLGTNGRVTYSIKDNSGIPANPPFSLAADDGMVTTKRDLSAEMQKPAQYRFKAVATDNPILFSQRQTDEANVYINLIHPFHRFVMVFQDRSPEDILPKKEFIRQVIQNVTRRVAIIEKVEKKRFLNDMQNVLTDTSTVPDSDLYFVLQQTIEPYHLINNTEQDTLFPENVQDELKNRIGGDPSLKVIIIRKPFDSQASRIFQLSKSYVWWLDDPWAALVALAAISILLCLVGLIVIIFTHSRYTRYINEYAAAMKVYDQPEFVEPPSFLREYETQSLNMYVPPDEAVQDSGEINLTFEGDNLVAAEHIGGDQGITSAVNPIYQEDDSQIQQPRPTGFTESTTML
ncbi:protocadherin Fat 3-like [Saccostrea cucullata]|uniref:protocadherin Fat 3-like n=1 Tax=Saccostrea cuccullata TaxID=36930 RepID=UPI002ED0068C